MTNQEIQRRGLVHVINDLEAENERLRALVASIPAIKANVRDACSVACAEVVAEAQSSDMGALALARESGAEACVDAIAAIDLEAL